MAAKKLKIKINKQERFNIRSQNVDSVGGTQPENSNSKTDALAKNIFNVNEYFIVELTKESQIGSREADFCKILKFTNEWNICEITSKLAELNPVDFPNLFIFIIEIKSEEDLAKIDVIEESLKKFSENRPLLLQQALADTNNINYYYKEDQSEKFILVDQQVIVRDIKDFPSFLFSYLNDSDKTFEEKVIDRILHVQNPSLILRFLKTLNLSDKFLGDLIFEITKSSKNEDFLAVLDVPFGGDGKKLSFDAQDMISSVFYENQFIPKTPTTFTRIPSEEEKVNDISINVQPSESSNGASNRVSANILTIPKLVPTPIPTKQFNPSVLHAAIKNKNKFVIDYLINNWCHLIQDLPFDHQVDISTVAYTTNQLNVLCDLLELSDFPYPKNFKDGDEICDGRLQQITSNRKQLKRAIKGADLDKIDSFIDSHKNLKIIYTPNNKSAMQQAIESKKCQIYFHLKSFGCKATEFDNLEDVLDGADLKEANEYKLMQRRTNVRNALQNGLKSINTLRNKSFIHNRKISHDQEIKYHRYIKQWLKDIKNIENGHDFLDVVASCDYLKIIFDFESDTVENASLSGPYSSGSLYSVRKWIFIGAKFSDNDTSRKNQIKGVLAHELCHYVMKLVYQNQENPYYENRTDIKEIFDEIIKEINKWSGPQQENIEDDGCGGTISTVFRLYDPRDYHAELIVRVMQILVEYHDDKDACKFLQEKYQKLFDFWYQYVIPDIQNYLQKNKEVIRLNGFFGILHDIKQQNYELSNQNKVDGMEKYKLLIVVTNIHKLLLTDIFRYLQTKNGILVDSLNIFVNPQLLENYQILNDFHRISFESEGLRIIVDCTNGVDQKLDRVFVRKEFNFVFIVSSENQCEMLLELLYSNNMENLANIEISYNWSDLVDDSQKQLLKTEVRFQNILKTNFMDLLSKDAIPDISKLDKSQEDLMIKDFSDVADDQLLNMFTSKSKISINTTFEYEECENNFDLLFELRKYVKKVKNENANKMLSMLKDSTNNEDLDGGPSSNPEERRKIKLDHKISQEELLNDVKNKPYVLISDIAGTGKSWAMKNFAKVLRKNYARKWVTYVDLKQYIKDFESKTEPDFAFFVAEKMLKSKNKFERKLFQKFYKNGKTIVLFDGFDEIAPNCAEYVSKLIKSFKFNGGNQLWIATRDYFEVDLQTNLQHDVAYKLAVFTKKNGINFIVATWMLQDLKDVNIRRNIDLKQYISSHPNRSEYESLAKNIVDKVAMTKNRSVGLPQLFKMIADGFKDDIDSIKDLKGSKIYEKFAKNLYKRWSDEKGKIRNDASIDSQAYELSFIKFHQYSAVVSLFPELAKILFPNYDGSEWSDAEIIACGLMSKKNGKFYFLHETFREYFFTDAIVTAITELKIVRKFFFVRIFDWKDQKDLILDLFVQILTVEKFGVIRMFLNDAIGGNSHFDKSESDLKLQEICHKLYEMENFEEFFIKNLEHLADFILKVFKKGNHGKIKNILKASAWNIITKTEDSHMFIKFQNYLFDFLKDDLKTFIIDQEIFHAIIRSSHSIKVFENFLTETEAKTDEAFIKKGLQIYSKNDWNGNIFYFLCESFDLNIYTVHKFFKILQEFLTTREIFKLVKNCNKYGQNILQFCVRSNDKEYFDILWREIEQIFPFKSFKELILQRDSLFCENISHSVILRKEIEIHKSLWELLLKVFDDREELKKFILQIGQFENNFVFKLVELNENPEVIELAFDKFKELFGDIQDFLATKSFLKMNLLHASASKHKNIKIHKFLWKVFRDSCNSEENYLNILKETDRFGYNVLHHAVENSSNEVYEFMMKEFEAVASVDDIRSLLTNLGQHNRNILQSAVKSNNCPKLHANLWKTLRNYFNSEEVLELINHVNKRQENLLILAAENNTKEIMDQTWIEIKGSFRNRQEMLQYLEMKEWKESKYKDRHFDNWRCKNEIHDWVRSLVDC